jgi:hypothetical protein
MLRRAALLRTDVSGELSASIIGVTRIAELGKTVTVASNQCTLFVFLRSMRQLLVATNVVPSSPILVTLMMEPLSSSETSVLTRATSVTSQKTPFFRRIKACGSHALHSSSHTHTHTHDAGEDQNLESDAEGSEVSPE